MSLDTISMKLPKATVVAVEALAKQWGLAPWRAMDRLLGEFLQHGEEVASKDDSRFDAKLLQIVVEYPFIVAMYDGRFAAVAVDLHESGKVVESFNGNGNPFQRSNAGKPPLVSWCDWFVAMCRRSGMELEA
jgi:hypothetical protein